MRIIVITQDEPFYLPLFFAKIKSLLKKHKARIIILPATRGFKGPLKQTKKYYHLYGLPLFLRQSLKFSLYKTLGLINSFSRFYSVASLARANKIPFASIKDLRKKQSLEKIKKASPDLIISIAPPQIFPPELLQIPALGCINIHQGLLPKYRGINPSFWALLNDEKETGVSIHFMDQKIDNGPILLQEKVKIETAETLHSLYLKNIEIGAAMLAKAVALIEKGDYQTIPNPKSDATYFSFPDKKSAKRFRGRGKKFF